MTRYYKSFVGRDFKLLAQLAVHLLSLYMDDGVWLKLPKVNVGNTCNIYLSYMFMYNMCQQVFRIAYCQPFDPEMVGSYSQIVTAI